MKEYHKIDSVFKRTVDGKRMLFGEFSRSEFALLKDCEWVWTEKIDGTNIRVMWDGTNVKFGGKTDDAQMPVFLLYQLEKMFNRANLTAALKGPCCLYGEGFGAKIQKGGGDYIPDGVSFILFDVLAEGEFKTWLTRETVAEIAVALGCQTVPEIGRGSLQAACDFVQAGYKSTIAKVQRDAEGLVMRPATELLTRTGSRVITKIKHKDFRP